VDAMSRREDIFRWVLLGLLIAALCWAAVNS
jgi:hypothetical protein